ncbi:carbohydrate kinase family protein [Roseobacter sp.]|uniref:carbohydrate kinase family protein n=1 Tax=Roseobacter sp. TaxID=1907202 RepID=UPI00385D5E1F
MIPELVTVGGLTVDNVVNAEGRVALAQAGGNGAYSAVGALMWCDKVGLVSAAVESYPRSTLSRLEAAGVDLSGVAWFPERLAACSWFIYDEAGERDEGLTSPPEALGEAGFPTELLSLDEIARWRRHLVSRHVEGEIGYSEFRDRHPLTTEQIPKSWNGVRGVHLAPSQPDVMLAMLEHFGSGPIITADPGWQLAARSLDEISPILNLLDAFLPSKVELAALVPGAAPAHALAELSQWTQGAVAVKLGPKGVLVWDRGGCTAVEVPAENVDAVDPTGAGDSFSGGFLAGLVEMGDPVAAARFGAISASRIVRTFGADGPLPVDKASMRSDF